MVKHFGSTTAARRSVRFVCAFLILSSVVFAKGALAQQALFFAPGNIVVAVEGCGVYQGTCTNIPNGTGTAGSYGDNQAAPFTLFQFKPNAATSATFVNSLVLPQTASGANLPISGEYGSSSEGGLQLSGTGQYLTLGTYGINAAVFDAAPATYGAAPSLALAQSGSLTGQTTYTPIARVVTLVDPYGNVNSSTGVFNIFNTNNPRSVYSADGTTAYLSGQGSSDATGGVFYSPIGSVNNTPTAITGLDTSANTLSQDTRFVTAYNNTLYVSVDTKGGSNNARSFVGTLGTPPSTTLFNSSAGPTQLVSSNNAAVPTAVTSTGKVLLQTTEANTVNIGQVGKTVNMSPSGFFFANAYTLYIADTGNPKQNSATSLYGDGGLQKWINTKTDGTGTWVLQYTMSLGLNLVANTSAVPANTTGSSGLYGLTGVVSGSNVYLYATNATLSDLDPTYLYGISDPLAATVNPGAAFAVLATAPADSNFKGVSFAPSLPAGSATLTSVPSGLSITTAGAGCVPGTYTTPVTLLWTPGSACTLTTTTPQTSNATPYVFTNWQDSTTSTTDKVVAPATSATYTATFTNNYQPVGVLEKAVDNTTASSNVTVGDSLLVSGWVADPVDGSPLSNVKVYIDGNLVGAPTLGIARTDVAASQNNPAYTNSGYSLVTPTTSLALGAHAVTVIAVDSTAHSTTFGPLTFNIMATPTVSVVSSSIVYGASTATLTANVAYTGSVAPTGAVTFTVNGSAVGIGPATCTGTTSPLKCTATDSSSSTLTAGSYPVVATIAGTSSYVTASGSGTLTVTTATDFSFTNTGVTSQLIVKGGTVGYIFSLTKLFPTYPGTVSFSATGLPSNTIATFSPASVPATGATQTITLTLQTSSTSASNKLPGSPWRETTLALAGICLLPLCFRRRLRSGLTRNLALLLLIGGSLAAFTGLTGCSKGALPVLPATYNITVTATSGSVQHAAVVTLVLQTPYPQ